MTPADDVRKLREDLAAYLRIAGPVPVNARDLIQRALAALEQGQDQSDATPATPRSESGTVTGPDAASEGTRLAAGPASDPSQPAAGIVDTTKVICPNCVHQFRAIPVDVQQRIAALEREKAALAKDAERYRQALGIGPGSAIDAAREGQT